MVELKSFMPYLELIIKILCYILFLIGSHAVMANTKTQETIEELRHLSLETWLAIKVARAGKAEEKASEVPASLIVITRKKIEIQRNQTLEEILQNIPGFYALNSSL